MPVDAPQRVRRSPLSHRVVIDACVLAHRAVVDVLLTLAEIAPALCFPLWSEALLAEVFRTQVGKIGRPEPWARSFRAALLQAFPDSMVSGYEHWLPQCTNHEKDRHVLACAIEGRASKIVTFNLRDFGAKHLERWELRALHPQDYLLELYQRAPVALEDCIETIVSNSRAPMSVSALLSRLQKPLPAFTSSVLATIEHRGG